MTYRIVKQILKIALFIFFKKIVVSGIENIPSKGPMILAANHPNTMLDPLIIATLTEQRVGFVANASIFSHKVLVAFFRFFHVIPIFRKKDIGPGEEPDNKASFIKCHEYLKDEGTFIIFPEGSSYYELKLREIKTGTARIALSYEDPMDFQGQLKIVPIALDYSDAIQFRSMVSVIIEPPLLIGDYQEEYLKDERNCVKLLTEDLRKELAKNIPQTSGKEQERFLINAHRFYTTYYEPDADLHRDPSRSLELRKLISRALSNAQKRDTELYQDTQTKVNKFFDELKLEGITTGFLSDGFLKKNILIVCLGYVLTLLSLLPAYLFGLVTNYLPYLLPTRIFAALKIDIEYRTSVALGTGVITFPLFYSLELMLFNKYVSPELWHNLVFLLLLPLTGYITMFYWTEIKRFERVIKFYFFVSRAKKTELTKLRNEILENMDRATRKYSDLMG